VSELILNSTSAQLGYTVPFKLVHTGKYRTEDKLKTDTPQSKTKLAWFSHFLRHSARKQGRLILQHSWAHTGQLLGESLRLFAGWTEGCTCDCANKTRQDLSVWPLSIHQNQVSVVSNPRHPPGEAVASDKKRLCANKTRQDLSVW